MVGCNNSNDSISVEKPAINLFDYFTEVLRLDFKEEYLASYQPSKMIVKGVFGSENEFYVMLDYQLQRCIIVNKADNSIERTFDIPQKEGCSNTQMVEILSLDSIIYLNDELQQMLIYNVYGFKQAYSFEKIREHHHELMKIHAFSEFLRSIDGYIGFTTWIDYGAGGPDVDYDSLMDDRNMVAFFKAQADSFIMKEVPIKPFLKRTTFPDLMFVDKPFFEVNTSTREVLVFHVSTDMVYSYSWDTDDVKKQVITGSSVKLLPAKLPRKGHATEILLMYEKQERGHHKIFFDSTSGKYIRYLEKKFSVKPENGLPLKPDIRLLQLLNEDFEVEAEMDFPLEYGFPTRVNGAVYLRKFDDEKKELIIYKFELPAANKEVTDAAF